MATLAPRTTLPAAELSELLQEALLAAAEALGPLPSADRDRIRALLYQIIDTAPVTADTSFVAALAADAAMVPNVSAATDLALLLGRVLGTRVMMFVGVLFDLIAGKVMEALGELVEAAERQVRVWVEQLQDLTATVAERLLAVAEDITRLVREADAATDQALASAQAVLGLFSGTSAGRAALREALRAAALDKAEAALAQFPGYAALAREAQRQVEAGLRSVVNGQAASILVDPVLDALGATAPAGRDVLARLEALEPGDDIAAAIVDIVLDQLEDAVRANFGGGDPVLPLTFRVPVDYRPPLLPRVQFTFEVQLGSVRVPLQQLLTELRRAARQWSTLENAAQDLAAQVERSLVATARLGAAETEQAALRIERANVDQRLTEADVAQPAIVIEAPRPGAVLTSPVTVVLRLPGTPRSFLGPRPGEQPRIMVWLNSRPIPLTRFSPDDPATGEARPPAPPGRRENLAGLRPGGRADPFELLLRTTLAADELHAGINTLNVAVVTGRAQQRVTKSVSFAAVPSQPTTPARPPGRPTRPAPPRIPDNLPDGLQRLVAEAAATGAIPGVAAVLPPPVSSGAPIAAGPDGHPDRPPGSVRIRSAVVSRPRREIPLSAVEVVQEMSRAVRAGQLRPQVDPLPEEPETAQSTST